MIIFCKTFLNFIITLFLASIFIFLALDILPGNISQILMGIESNKESLIKLNQELNLNLSFWNNYKNWILGIFKADLGDSYIYKTPVLNLIIERLKISFPLAVFSIILTIIVSFTLGIYLALKNNSLIDFGLSFFIHLGLSIPNFLLAIILIIIFSINFRLLPASGYLNLKSLILPIISLTIIQSSILIKIIKSSILEVLKENFIVCAKAKGLNQKTIFLRHILPNSMPAILTILGLQFANLLTGSIVIENIFNLPGLGSLIFQSIANRDLIVLRNCLMFSVFLILSVNYSINLLNQSLNPRIKNEKL